MLIGIGAALLNVQFLPAQENDPSYPLQIIKNKEGAVIQVELIGIELFNKVKECESLVFS